MTNYKVAIGWNIALVSLVDIVPRCRGGFIKATERTYAVDGTVNQQGLYVEFLFDLMHGSTDYLALLTQFGIHVNLTGPVTVYVRDSTFAWVRKNGLAVQPEIGEDVDWVNFFPRNIAVLVKNIWTPV